MRAGGLYYHLGLEKGYNQSPPFDSSASVDSRSLERSLNSSSPLYVGWPPIARARPSSRLAGRPGGRRRETLGYRICEGPWNEPL